jgi:hypothetical protein
MPQVGTGGSPTFNADGCLIDTTGADRVRAIGKRINTVQGWFAARIKFGFASTEATNKRFFTYGAITTNEVFCDWASTSQITCGRDGTGSGSPTAVLTPPAFLIDTDHTVIATWDAANIKISWDGSAFTSFANAKIVADPPERFDIGYVDFTGGTLQCNSTFRWMALGLGAIADGDATTLHSFGNSDPDWYSLPGQPVFLWKCATVDYEDGLPPTPVYQEFPKPALRAA